MTAAITIDRIDFSYQDAPVLKGVSFAVDDGQFVGIIGPNGGGKTTLLKLILGFLKPNQGSISVFGSAPETARRYLAYVPQSLRFDKQFPISVGELVLEGRLSRLPWYGIFSKEDKQAAMRALEKVGLPHLYHRPFGSLSGGQAQRVLIARALASEPRLLILDEPTASVDAQAEGEIYSLLKKLQGEITIVMVTHNLQAAIELVDKVVCVQQTAQELDPKQVCEHYAMGLYHPPLLNLGSRRGEA